MRFPLMLTKDNDKKIKEIKDNIVKWMDKYFEEKEKRIDFEDKYNITKGSLKESNAANKELKGKIIELERQLKNKDNGIKALKEMLEERTTDSEQI